MEYKYYISCFKINSWLPFKETNLLKVSSNILDLHGTQISPANENNRSTAAEEVRLVLYFINIYTGYKYNISKKKF